MAKNSAPERVKQTELSAHYAQLRASYSDIPASGVMSAFSRTTFGNGYTDNPYIQNQRIKGISSRSYPYSKDKIAEFLKAPQESEQPLRQVMNWAQYSAYPIYNIIKTYQDVPTYRWYNHPRFLEETDAGKPEFMREWRLLEKICAAIKPSEKAHEIVGQCGIGGKAHYYVRKRIDKAHNACDYTFIQQLPQDWTKIVGYNNITKYTLMFNMMYFMTPGTDWRQFGALFEPYISDMGNFVDYHAPTDVNKIIYSSMPKDRHGRDFSIDLKKLSAEKATRNVAGNPDVYVQNGEWFYWVTLPVEDVWTFEIDDVSRNVVSPFTGLIMSAVQQADYEAVQLAILQNPLISCVLAEMPLLGDADATQADPIKISPATRAAYEAIFYNMMAQNNTSGIGLFAAPYEDMKLVSLQEAPNASNISSDGYQYLIQKSGIGIISASPEPRVGMVNISAQLAAKFAQCVYRQFENMMNHIYKSLNLRFEWGFKMFGDIFSEKDDLKSAKDGMTLGILLDTLRYDAIRGHSILDDISISNAVIESGLLGGRVPLISSYSAKGGVADLPPASGGKPSAIQGEAGRPKNEQPQSEGAEQDADSYIEGKPPTV